MKISEQLRQQLIELYKVQVVAQQNFQTALSTATLALELDKTDRINLDTGEVVKAEQISDADKQN